MKRTPGGSRLHIGLLGRRNVGKSSLLNALTRQTVSIVSADAGTTTDPVGKPMELLPLGPVLLVDTAGLDDEGALGALRVERSRRVLDRLDIGLVIAEAASWGRFEEELLDELRRRGITAVVVFNQCDRQRPARELVENLRERGLEVVETVAPRGEGLDALRAALVAVAPEELLATPTLLADLVGPDELAVLVVPIDKEAPKGRLILPQAQAIRDLLDHHALSLVLREDQLRAGLERLNRPPRLVVTDSQAFRQVASMVPEEIPMTGFSVLFARLKGDLPTQVAGAMTIDGLRPGDRVLIAEACSHHPIGEDIGRVKIPRWLQERVGGPLGFDTVQGRDFPADLGGYDLVVHCGACMWNRRAMLTRLVQCREQQVPVTNYGLAIAYALGLFERALQPFPEALAVYRRGRSDTPAEVRR
jgi:[FeFe] hydrogenase H-cluster maturation GTPase HydF